MSKRQEKIVKFFSNLLTNSNSANFEEVIEQSISLFDEITHVMKNGTKEEQVEIEEALKTVNQKISDQFDQACEELGIDKAEVDSIIKDPSNFSPEVWEALQQLQSQVASPVGKEEEKKKPKKKKTKQWISA